jgi:hypothetical protein
VWLSSPASLFYCSYANQKEIKKCGTEVTSFVFFFLLAKSQSNVVHHHHLHVNLIVQQDKKKRRRWRISKSLFWNEVKPWNKYPSIDDRSRELFFFSPSVNFRVGTFADIWIITIIYQ